MNNITLNDQAINTDVVDYKVNPYVFSVNIFVLIQDTNEQNIPVSEVPGGGGGGCTVCISSPRTISTKLIVSQQLTL